MYQFLTPTTLEQAVEMLHDKDSLRILAGGTDLIIALKSKTATCNFLMDCKKIPELQLIQMTDKGLEIGAAVSLNEMEKSGLLTGEYAAILEGSETLANVLLRNRATLVGNLCNASPGGDMCPACLVLGGSIETISPRGSRVIPIKEFFTGVKRHVLAQDELVVKTVFPIQNGVSTYKKKKRIGGHDLAQVGIAAFLAADGNLKIALGAVGPTPILLDDLGVFTKDQLSNQKDDLLKTILENISPIGDVRSSKNYRLAMVKYLYEQIIDEFLAKMEVIA